MENQNLTIELPVAAWNVIMNALCGRPFGEVHEIIGEIRSQSDAQLNSNRAAGGADEGVNS